MRNIQQLLIGVNWDWQKLIGGNFGILLVGEMVAHCQTVKRIKRIRNGTGNLPFLLWSQLSKTAVVEILLRK
jgi:hypothetical protein